MNLENLIDLGKKYLKKNSIKRPSYEALLVYSKLKKYDLSHFWLNKEKKISEKEKKNYLKKIFFRSEGKPLSKIIGVKEFYSRAFFTSCNTLDPRPDSESMIEIIKLIEKKKSTPVSILDLGTGSGCLLITIGLELQNYRKIFGLGVDISKKALKIAKKNSMKHNINKKLTFKRSNWFSEIKQSFDIIISNPPYIGRQELSNLEKSVKDFDPKIALDGGIDGLNHYRSISKSSKNFLKKGGYICLEIGHKQKNDVETIFTNNGFKKFKSFKDLKKNDRILIFKNKI